MMRRLALGIAAASSWPFLLAAGTPANPFKKPAAPAPVPVVAPAVTPSVASSTASAETIKALLATARKAKGAKAAPAWQAVLRADEHHSEALFALAVLDMAGKRPAEAMARLTLLSKQARDDAQEFLIEARRHAAFEAVRAQASFRDLVGLGRAPTTDYEMLMGHGGQWEQGGTACDRAEVALQLRQTRAFALRVTTRCDGEVSTMKFRGTWKLEAATPGGVQLQFGKPGKGDSKAASEHAGCALAPVADEFSLTCAIDEDLTLTLLPARR
ncbi:MAG: hypothetical protein IPL79_02000 [Myxococcales bacterium]|nr:hypothetical protein [Myxococcales bacterium]